MVDLAALPVVGVFFTPELWTWMLLYAAVALSLNLEAGLTGIPNFGRHLAVIVGAIVAATLPGYLGMALLPESYRAEIAQIAGTNVTALPSYASDYNSLIANVITKYYASHPATAFAMFLVVVVVAAALGALSGLLAAYPAARLREDYLAITLLAAGEAMLIISYNAGFLGGTQGLTVPNTLAWLDTAYARIVGPGAAHKASVLTLTALLAALVFLYLELVVRAPIGRLLKSVRENDVAAEALGKDVARVRLKTLMMGSAIAALTGAMFVMWNVAWMAKAYDRVNWTFWPWAMLILGGAGNNLGVTVGAFILGSLRQLITFNKQAIAPYLPFNPAWLDYLVLGFTIILVLMLKPEGLLPEKTTYPLPREKLREIAKKHGAPEEAKATAEKASLEQP